MNKTIWKWTAVDANCNMWKYENEPYLDLEENDSIWFAKGEMVNIGLVDLRYLSPRLGITVTDWKKTKKKIELDGEGES